MPPLMFYQRRRASSADIYELISVLLGGFTTNFIWCLALNIKNRQHNEFRATLIVAGK